MSWASLPPIEYAWLGRVPYRRAWASQQERRDQLLQGLPVQEGLWCLEHDAVLTTGLRRGVALPDASFFARWGAEHVRVERGGLATWHAPGQLVLYTILRLPPRGLGPRTLVRGLEDGLIGLLADLGILAQRREGAPGVWVGADKIGSVGVHVRRGVSLHGAALNVDLDLRPMREFVPCGVEGAGVTSIRELRGEAAGVAELAQCASDHVLWALLQASVDATPAGR